MGMFDTFSGWSTCSHCGEYNQVEIQFKWLDSSLATFTVGDYVDGHVPFSIFSREENNCTHCKKEYETYVLGKMGYLYGFCNEVELEKIKELVPLERRSEYVSFMIEKNYLTQNPEEAFKQLKEAYYKNPNETEFVFTGQINVSDEVEELVCRIPSTVNDPRNRPNIGDTVYVDNRTGRYRLWHLQDDAGKVIERNLNEHNQTYRYTISFASGAVWENVEEVKLVDEEKRNQIVTFITKSQQELLHFWETKNQAREGKEDKLFRFKTLMFSLHYGELIREMIEEGMLPKEFTFEK